MISAREALERLREGNQRFLSDVRANIRASANHLRRGSGILEQLIQKDGLLVVGAEYSLETGLVDFFDGVPEPDNKRTQTAGPTARR